MALVKGTTTVDMNIGASYSAPQWYFTQNHTVDTGTDRMLVVVIASTSSLTLTNVKYAGVTMSQGGTWNSAPGSTQYSVFYLANPTTGSNALTVDSSNNGIIALLCQSFTGADTTIQVLHNDLADTPHSQTITISANSMIMCIGSSLYTFDTNAITIDGTGFGFSSCDLNGSVSTAQFCAHTRNTNLSSGSKTVITDTIADSFQATNTRVEIKEKAVTIVVPTVTTTTVTSIAQTTATGGGNVNADGGATVTARGVCWSTSPNPDITNSKTTDGSGTGSFTSSITGLTANTGYYIRAYATNSAGTGYGSHETFATLSAARRRIIII